MELTRTRLFAPKHTPRSAATVGLLLGLLSAAQLAFTFTARAQAEDVVDGSMQAEVTADRQTEFAPAPTLFDAPQAHVLLRLGAGLAIRGVRDVTLRQDWAAPAFVDLSAEIASPHNRTHTRFFHAVGLGLSTNLTGDGGAGAGNGVDPLGQWVIAPSYGLYFHALRDLFGFVHVSPQISLGAGLAPGIEVSLGASYLFLAGLGLYAEVAALSYWGRDLNAHPLLAGEVGFVIDVELLP